MLLAGLALTVLASLVLSVSLRAAQERERAAEERAAQERTTGQDKKTTGADHEADKKAIEKLTKDSVKAFENRDAAALVVAWTTDGEFIRNDGQPIRGKADIQKGYADYFKTLKANPKLEIQIDGLRFPSQDTAITEVTLRLKNDEGDVIGSSWRNTLLVREGGQWKVAIVREWDRDVSLDDNLKDLEWLIGSWHAANKDRELSLVYEWDEHKTFILGKYTVKEGGKVVESGKQRIGKDNAEGAIRSWVFQDDGGFGGGVWSREGKKWSVDVYGVTAEGQELTATSIYVRVDANNFTWQAVGQALDGVLVPDTQPIKVTRQKAK
jgi:uncharacterized protein (TIGR02246 family)